MSVNLFLVLLALAVSTASAVMTWSVLRRDRERAAARVAALGAAIEPALETRFNDAGDAAPALFAAPEPPTRDTARLRLAVIGVMTLITVVAIGAQYRSAHRPTPAVAAAPAVPPLELMTMRHGREGGAFTVRGMVRNPSRSQPVSGLTAVVSTFDRNGTFVTSARAPIDFTTLQPGDESPFAVAIPTPGDIARYRVAFRTDAGVLQHVDRRQSGVNLAVNRQ